MKIPLLLALLALLGTTVAEEEAELAGTPRPQPLGVQYYCTMEGCYVCVTGFRDKEHCHMEYFAKRLTPSQRRNHSLLGLFGSSPKDVVGHDDDKAVRHYCTMRGCWECVLPARTNCPFVPFRSADAPFLLGRATRPRSNCNETLCWYCMGLGNCAARGDCCVYTNVLQALPAVRVEEQKSSSRSCHKLNGVETCTVCDASGACHTTTQDDFYFDSAEEQQPVAARNYSNCNATTCWLCMGAGDCEARGDCCTFVRIEPNYANCNATSCWECRVGCSRFDRRGCGCWTVPLLGRKKREAAASEEEQDENYGDGDDGKKLEAIRASRDEADFD